MNKERELKIKGIVINPNCVYYVGTYNKKLKGEK